MINGYGIFLICWLFVGLVSVIYNSHKEENPTARCVAYSIKFTIMVWLIFQI